MTLKVAVLVKQVPDPEAIVRVDSKESLDIENRWVCSFFDEIAIEAALELAKAHPDTGLVALGAGGRRAVEALRRAVAMGIDKVEHIEDESLDDADSLRVAAVLAARLRAIEPDLVLCGRQAGHDDQAAVGPMVAELMGPAHVSAAVGLSVDPQAGTARVQQRHEGELLTLGCPLPLVVSAERGLAEPHVPVVTRVMKAMKAKVDTIEPGALEAGDWVGEERVRSLGYRPPPSRDPVTMLEDASPESLRGLVGRLDERGVLPRAGGAD